MSFIGEKQLRKLEYKERENEYKETEREYNKENRKYMVRKVTRPMIMAMKIGRSDKPIKFRITKVIIEIATVNP